MGGRVCRVVVCLVLLHCTWTGTGAFGDVEPSTPQPGPNTSPPPPSQDTLTPKATDSSPNWTIGTGGNGSWQYNQCSQLGRNGFFGPYDIDQSQTPPGGAATRFGGGPAIMPGDFASLNGWIGVQNYQNPLNFPTATNKSYTTGFNQGAPPNILTSGTNATQTVLAMSLEPQATFTWASVWGRYKMFPYDTGTAPGAEVSISSGQWTNWGLTVTPPLGMTVTVGKNILHWGAGLQFSSNRTNEQILFESDEIQIPDVLAKWFPALMRLPILRPVGPGLMHICRKLKPGEKIQKDLDGTQYVVDRGGEDAIVKNLESVDTILKNLEKDNPTVKILQSDEHNGNVEYQEYGLNEPCPSGMVQVRWQDVAGNVISSLRRGTTVYEKTSNDFATLQFGLGSLPWLQDVLITSINPSIYSGITPTTTTANIFPFPWNSYDVNLAQRVNLLAFLVWQNDVARFEVGTLYSSSHAGPELAQTTAYRAIFPPTDRWTDEGWLFLEYCNGRFDLRTELDWFTRETRYQPSLNGTFFGFNDQPSPLLVGISAAGATNPTLIPAQAPPGAAHVPGSGSPFVVQYIESTRFMADARVFFGPAMFELFYSHMPGPDRRHGISM